jgi:hypothetical protein
MKRILITAILIFSLTIMCSDTAQAQCSVCTRTAQQLGEKPARGLNAGIIYLAFTPLAIAGIMGYRWYRKNKNA